VNADDPEQVDGATNGRPSSSSIGDVFLQRLGQLKRVAAGMGLGPADAEDVLQDVWIEARRQAEVGRNPDDAARWLIRVTVNRCLLEFRRRRRFQKAAAALQRRQLAEAAQAAQSPVDASIALEEAVAVRHALQDLDESLLCPLVLRYFCGLDATQVGEILQLPASTVRSRLRDARMILAKRLIERGLEP